MVGERGCSSGRAALPPAAATPGHDAIPGAGGRDAGRVVVTPSQPTRPHSARRGRLAAMQAGEATRTPLQTPGSCGVELAGSGAAAHGDTARGGGDLASPSGTARTPGSQRQCALQAGLAAQPTGCFAGGGEALTDDNGRCLFYTSDAAHQKRGL